MLPLSVIQLLSLIPGASSRGKDFSSSVMSGVRVLSSVMSAIEMSSLISVSAEAEAGIQDCRLQVVHCIPHSVTPHRAQGPVVDLSSFVVLRIRRLSSLHLSSPSLFYVFLIRLS